MKKLMTVTTASSIILRTPDWSAAQGLMVAVVIDVLRAFTTSRRLLECGSSSIILTADTHHALALKEQNPGTLILGEQGGLRVSAFDFDNSPSFVTRENVESKQIVLRTSNGVPAVLNALERFDLVYASSLRDADAVVTHIRGIMTQLQITEIELICSDPSGKEDWACAQYIAVALANEVASDREQARIQIESSAAAVRLTQRLGSALATSEVLIAVQHHEGNFVQQARVINDRPALVPVPLGACLST